ncbi:thioesterase family protein [Micropruina sp.]|uniref:acyl-CoA thioesterase n=1 Tax=Micropruina sp. TaxID=2737536 RepID=UPI002626D8C5|nr:thioesterase family protein [Micropruina sp.]
MNPAAIIRVPLRWVDLDAQGHVNNALIADYLQEARVRFLLEGENAALLGHGTLVVGHQVEYLAPVEFRTEPVEVRLWVGNVGASRFTIGYEVVQDGMLAARARTVLCIFDFDAGRPRRMTPTERAWFVDRSSPLEPLRPLGKWRPGERAHTTPLTVRWTDLDAYGHVNNVRFFDFVAEARVQMSSEADQAGNRMSAAAEAGYLWMVARQDVDYLAQLDHRLEPYQTRVAVAEIGRTSMTLVAEVTDPLAGVTHARARTVLVCGDRSGRPIPVPDELRRGMELWPAEQF